MKSKRLKFILIAALLTVIAGWVAASSLAGAGSYVPDNKVEGYNYKRSQEYVDGKGYTVHDREIKKHKEEEKQKKKIVRKEPKTRAQRKLEERSAAPARKSEPEKKPEKKEKEQKKKEPEVKEEELPVIKTNLKNGEKVAGTTKKFTVKASSYSGETIDASKIVVLVNGVRLLEQGAGSYIASLKKGRNRIEITATDEDGKEKTRSFRVTCDPDGKKEPVGKLSVVVTAKVLGINIVVPKRSMDFYESDQLSDVVARYFEESKDVKGVNIASGYYELGHVQKKGVINEIPESVRKELEEQGLTMPDNKDSLGLNTFGAGSGWLYAINGNQPGQYMSSMDPVKNATVEILYTLTAM